VLGKISFSLNKANKVKQKLNNIYFSTLKHDKLANLITNPYHNKKH